VWPCFAGALDKDAHHLLLPAVSTALTVLERALRSESCAMQAIELRKTYIQQYVTCLQEEKMGGDEAIQEMDAQLNEPTILVFRKLAHAKVSPHAGDAMTVACNLNLFGLLSC
jgi:hypothetical protein